MTPGPGGDRERPVDHLERRDADRASGAVDHLDLVGQQLVDAVADDRMGLAAADLHDRPAAGGGLMDLVEQSAGEIGVAEFVEVLHRRHLFLCCDAGLLRGQLEPVAELLFEDAELLEVRERLLRRLLVQALDGEADVHDHVLPDDRVGDVGQADIFGHAAEVDVGHQGAVTLGDADDASRDR